MTERTIAHHFAGEQLHSVYVGTGGAMRGTVISVPCFAGISALDGLRAKEPLAKELCLAGTDDETILDAMIAHPILIERPLVETDRGVRLGRPPETVREIL